MMKPLLLSTVAGMLLISSNASFARIIDNVAIAKETIQIAQSIETIKDQENNPECVANIANAVTRTKEASRNIYRTQYLLASSDLMESWYSLRGERVKTCSHKPEIKNLENQIWHIKELIAGLD